MLTYIKRRTREIADFLPVIAVSTVGLIASIVIFIAIRNYYISGDQRQFEDDASYYTSAFKSAIERHVTSLSAIHAFVSASHAVNRWEFSSFARQILPQNSGFKAVLWLPRLKQSQRSEFEAALQKDGLYGLKIRDALPNGKLIVSPRREDYLPVAFVEPFENSGDLIAVDLRNNSMYGELFLAAAKSGKQEASPPMTQALVEGATPPLVLLAFPLITSAHSSLRTSKQELEGYVLGILQLRQVINPSFGSRLLVQAAIAYGSENTLTVLGNDAERGITDRRNWVSGAEFTQEIPLLVAGQPFRLLLRSSTQGKPLTRFYAPMGAMLLVLTLTALLGQSLATSVLRKRLIERAVVVRTSELRELNETLKAEIEQRKQAECSLVLARDHAETANRAKSAFLSTMTHELRTPLNAIIGFSSILAEGDDAFQAKSDEYLREINSSGVKLLELINDILDITQMDSQVRNNGDPVSITDIIEVVVGKLSGFAAEEGVTLEARIEPNLPLLLADGKRLQRAIFHLLHNAVKFSGKGSTAVLSVRACHSALVLEIDDDGVGMDFSSNIESYFSQADDSLARKHEGVGVGLTYVRRAMEQHEAKVQINSAPGEGTTVVLIFPSHRLTKTLEVA